MMMLTTIQRNFLSRYEALVDRVMASNDMNQVYVLPQLHTLLWSNKKGV